MAATRGARGLAKGWAHCSQHEGTARIVGDHGRRGARAAALARVSERTSLVVRLFGTISLEWKDAQTSFACLRKPSGSARPAAQERTFDDSRLSGSLIAQRRTRSRRIFEGLHP